MDSIFDDDVDAVGNEIEAYCPGPRCKADTTHTIISMYEDEVRRVQCVVCGDVHAYRKPRGEALEEGSAGTDAPPRKKANEKPTWEQAMAQVSEAELATSRPYSTRDSYEELDIVYHPKFDIGFVTELLPDNKVEITFKDWASAGRRILVHNRSDLAQRMPDISEAPPPRDPKKKKRPKKKKEESAAPAAAPSRPVNLEDWAERARNAAAAKKAAMETQHEADVQAKVAKGKAAKPGKKPEPVEAQKATKAEAAKAGAAKAGKAAAAAADTQGKAAEPKGKGAAAAKAAPAKPEKADKKAAGKPDKKPVKAAAPAKPEKKSAKPDKKPAKAAAPAKKPAKAAAPAKKVAAKAKPVAKPAKKPAAKKPPPPKAKKKK
jgi:hypothetical protein